MLRPSRRNRALTRNRPRLLQALLDSSGPGLVHRGEETDGQGLGSREGAGGEADVFDPG